MFQINEQVLKSLERTLAKFPKAYLHGNGMIYIDLPNVDESEQPSLLAKKYNPGADIRILFQRGDQLPKTADEAVKMLIAAKANDDYKNQMTKDESRQVILKDDEEMELMEETKVTKTRQKKT
jgi:hypothetical protein